MISIECLADMLLSALRVVSAVAHVTCYIIIVTNGLFPTPVGCITMYHDAGFHKP